MKQMWILQGLVFSWLVAMPTKVAFKAVEEYCSYETFTAECPGNDLIMINHARYGRMSMGRCVKSDLGHLGCSVDALLFLDSACSGKQSCDYFVAGKDLRDTDPCSTDVSSYLEIDYNCVSVARADQSYPCSSNPYISIESSFGYIASNLLDANNWGTLTCPWRLEAFPGQSINLTLINFQPSGKQHTCKPIGFATDEEIHQNVTICLTMKREEHLMLSVGHRITIQFLSIVSQYGNLLVKHEVVGCADLVAPANAWHRRKGNTASIGCQYNNRTWHLFCDGHTWQGVVGNCSTNSKGIAKDDLPKWPLIQTGMPFIIIIVGVVVATLLIAFCIIMMALKPSCCCTRSIKQDSNPHFDANSVGTSYGYASNKAHTRSSWACTFKSGANTSNHIWETPLPEPSAPPATQHMLAATMRHPNPMETSITSSGGDYTWPTRFMASSNVPFDPSSADYTHPSVEQNQHPSGDDYTVPVNATQSCLHTSNDDVNAASNHDDYMTPSEIYPKHEDNTAKDIVYPTDTFKRQLDKILLDNQNPLLPTYDNNASDSKQEVTLNRDSIVEYAIPNNKRLSQAPHQEQSTEEEEYILPTYMRQPAQNERNIPSAEQI